VKLINDLLYPLTKYGIVMLALCVGSRVPRVPSTRSCKLTKDFINIGDIIGVSDGQPAKGAVNIGDIVGLSGGRL